MVYITSIGPDIFFKYAFYNAYDVPNYVLGNEAPNINTITSFKGFTLAKANIIQHSKY